MAPRDTTQRFQAVLQKGVYILDWTTVTVPFVPHDVWSTMIRLRVCGSINGFAFRNSLFSVPGTGHVLMVSRTMQQGAGVGPGDVAEFLLQPDLEPRPAELPDELGVLLDSEEGLRDWYDSLSESMRREIGKALAHAKTDAARAQRCEQMAERLLSAMEGERELPPVLAAAFRRRPKAAQGWLKLTETQRRQELLAIFYYQSPEARLRRVDKVCDLAERRNSAAKDLPQQHAG